MVLHTFLSRALTPQVSYMKAIDLWVLICLLLTFTCLAEYGFILHMTSRSGWQKKMDDYVRTVSGKPHLRKVSAMEMGPISLRKPRQQEASRSGGYEIGHELRKTKSSSHIVIINPDQQRAPNGCAPPAAAVSTSPHQPATVTRPKDKLRIAYAIEFYAKIIYPLLFIVFNISYWSYYMLYASS